jgi:uncharacterized protein (DUF2141 family)
LRPAKPAEERILLSSRGPNRIHRVFSDMRISCLVAILSVAAATSLAERPLAAQAPGFARAEAKLGSQTCTLQIYVDGLRNSTGVVGTLIFTSSDGWPENLSKAYRSGPTPIIAGERHVTQIWEGIPPGDYGVVVLHDENSNMKLDRNLFGWPREGFGFSNNPHVVLGPPPFRDTLLHVACPATQTTIRMIYK